MVKTKTKPKYQLRAGARLPGVDIQEAAESLVELRKAKGWDSVPWEVLVVAARRKSHPLHNAFEWDDAKCGIAHRESQARYILRSIEVVRVGRAPIRAFWPVSLVSTKGPDSGYMEVERVLENPVTKAQVLDALKRKLRAVRDECAHYSKKAAAAVEVAHGIIDKIRKRTVG